VIPYDDLISTGTTIGKASKAVLDFGGRLLAICATHGVCCGKVNEVFDKLDCPILLADTIVPYRLSPTNRAKVELIDTTKMTADAILRIHRGTGSISELLETPRFRRCNSWITVQ